MLILTRKVNEKVIIGDEVEITVLRVSRDKVKLGIRAPESIMIQRNELLQSIGQENRRAAVAPSFHSPSSTGSSPSETSRITCEPR